MPVEHMTEKDAAESAELISMSIQYADSEAKRRTGNPDALAFPAALNRVWRAEDVLGHREKFPTSAIYREGGRAMAVVIAQHVVRDGVRVFNPVIGGTRISEIKPEEHEAYLYKPLELLVPEALALGITETVVIFDPGHKNLEDSLRTFSTANDQTIRDRGAVREYRTPLRLDEIRAKSAPLEGRDISAGRR